MGVASGVGTGAVGAVELAGAAGAAGRIAVFGKEGSSERPAAANRIATGKASTIARATTATAGASTTRRRRWVVRSEIGESITTGDGDGVVKACGGGGGIKTAALAGGAQSRCREQLAHQLSIA
ncbi:MAG: hypothetical protein M3Z28_09800 [Candidatus Dormibacteraeota bacterium]|nr:hypothetical protein [Candidatus Dormibacteraeota bacterium]